MGRRGKISIWEHQKTWGGGLNFSKMSEFQLFDSVFFNITFIRNVWKSKMSEFDPKGGSAIFKNVWNLKKSEISDGEGGSSLFGNFSQFFPFYFYDGSPYCRYFPLELVLLVSSITVLQHPMLVIWLAVHWGIVNQAKCDITTFSEQKYQPVCARGTWSTPSMLAGPLYVRINS